MKIKLTKSQMQSLEIELSGVVQFNHVDITDKMIAMLLNKLYKKIVHKLVDMQAHYTFTIDDEIAMALYLYYKDVAYNPARIADTIIKNICNEVDKQYS